MTIGRIIDVSSAQHPNNAPINWTAVRDAGVTTVLIKATEGTNYTNPFYRSDMLGAAAVELDVLAYHFASFTNPIAEAQKFMQVARRYARIGDFETSTNVAWMRQFLQTLGQPADHLLSYGSASTLKDIYAQLPSLAWPAAYGQGYPGWGVMWQFTNRATVAGIKVPVDESSWHGSEMQYEILFGLNDPPEPPVKPTEDDMLYLLTDSKDVGYVYWANTKVALPDETLPPHLIGITVIPKGQVSDKTIAAIPNA